MSDKTDEWIKRQFARVEALEATGMERGHAFSLASLEQKIEEWPKEWGHDVHVLIYGDFAAPKDEINIRSLGVRVLPKPRKGTIIRGALMVVDAIVSNEERSVAGLIDVRRRMNSLLGMWFLKDWGHGAVDWWCSLTHGPFAGVSLHSLTSEVDNMSAAVLQLPTEVQRRIRAALYWVREPRELFMQSYKSDSLRVYAGLWNAFECLVDAVELLRPQSKPALPERDGHSGLLCSARRRHREERH
jgi:hypothetical protein